MDALTLDLADAGATRDAGERLAQALRGGMLVTLAGDLGAGKTTLARGVLAGLGWTGPVKSPTFALVEHYPLSNLYLYHFDFYRFDQPSEWDDAGFAEAFRPDTVVLAEWPERVAGLLPPADCSLHLAFAGEHGESRRLSALAGTEGGRRCLDALLDGSVRGRLPASTL